MIISVVSLLILESCGSEGEKQTNKPVVQLTDDGGWCWFSDPRAVYLKGIHKQIYSGWVKSNGDIEVVSYDLDSKIISKKKLWNNFEKDDHDTPAFHILPDGKLQIYFSQHSGKLPIIQYTTSKPENISEGTLQKLELNDTVAYKGLRNTYTYVNVARMEEENNKMFIFWRGMDFKPNFSISEDLGKTWTKGKILILPDRIYEDRRPYVKYFSNGKNKIHIAFTDGHPRDEPSNSIYYMCYKGGLFLNATGNKLCDLENVPVRPAQADKVYDASGTGEKAWIWDVAEDKRGNPVLAYVRFPNDSMHIYCYARWNGQKWKSYQMVNSGRWFPHTPSGEIEREPNYSAGLALDHENPDIVYLSRKIQGIFEIEKWVFSEEKEDWSVFPITTGSTRDQVRPFAIQGVNSDTPYQVVWMNLENYIHYTDYHSEIEMF
jgi:hypothetical protein